MLNAIKKMSELQSSSVIIAVDNKPQGILTYVLSFLNECKFALSYTLLLLCCMFSSFFDVFTRSKDILMRVIIQNLPPESTTVDKVNQFVVLDFILSHHVKPFTI